MVNFDICNIFLKNLSYCAYVSKTLIPAYLLLHFS